jgi:CRP-like cAMP-binding protein
LKVKEIKYSPEDIIISKGEICNKFMFILSGTVSLFAISNINKSSIFEGTPKGEFKSKLKGKLNEGQLTFRLNEKMKYWSKCDNYVHIGYLTQDDFEEIMRMYPNDKILYDKYLEETQNDCDVCQIASHSIIK